MKKINNNKIQKISKVVGSIAVLFLFCCQIALAAESSVHTVTMKATYRHPITGVIEDSGGESGEAIGQGMVENVVDSKGLLEVDHGNNIYLTMRFNMTDSISKLSFQVQSTDASSFSNTQSEKVSESSSNHTVDYRILMPSNDGVIKVSAYVEPMGRSVVFYLQPTNMVAGNQTSFTASVSAQTTSNASGNGTVNGNSDTTDASVNTSSVLAEETGLTVSGYGKSTEGTQSETTSAATTENIAMATDESVSQTVAAMLAESAANQAAAQNTVSQDDDYIVMEDSAFIQVNRNFWLCLLLEMIVAMVSSGLILMGIHTLIRHFIEEKRKNRWDRGTEVLQDEEMYEE